MNPPLPTAIASPAYAYKAPDPITNVGYRYKTRIMPYTTFNFNVRPNYYIDQLIHQEIQFNIPQFTSYFYLDLVYY